MTKMHQSVVGRWVQNIRKSDYVIYGQSLTKEVNFEASILYWGNVFFCAKWLNFCLKYMPVSDIVTR